MCEKDFHPIMQMAENAVRLHEIASKNDTIDDVKRAIDAWDRIAKYTEPKLIAVDYCREQDRVNKVIVKRFDL